MRRRHRVAVIAFVGVCALLVAAPNASAVVKTVDCDHTALGPVLTAIPTNSTIKLKGVCTGNFVISKNITLIGAPTAQLNGGGTGSTLTLFGFHAFHLSHLDVVGGSASDGGGIEFQGGGLLTLDHVRVTGNSATGGVHPGSAHGGGIDVREAAFVTITNSTISNNHVSVSGANAEFADGGGLYATGQLTLANSTVNGNTAQASSNNNAGIAEGAGIVVQGSATLTSTKVTNNQANGQGPQFGDAHGGGVFWIPISDDVMRVTGSTISSNKAITSSQGEGDSFGGGVFMFQSAFGSEPLFVTGSTLTGNQATATGTGGSAVAEGGAIYASGSSPYPVVKIAASSITNSSVSADGGTTATGQGAAFWLFGSGSLTRSTLDDNTVSIQSGTGSATGGGGAVRVLAADTFSIASSGFDGNAVTGQSSSGASVSVSGGGLFAGGFRPVNVRSSTFSHNDVTTHTFGSSSEAAGGGIQMEGTDTDPGDLIVNSTIANNIVTGNGGPSPDSLGAGLAVFDKKLRLAFDSIVRNVAHTNVLPEATFGGGVYAEIDTDTTLFANVIALNTAATGPDCRGQGTSEGFNLLGTATDCAIATVASDQEGVAPKLGQLGVHGGSTTTVPLLTGSPALNRIAKAPCQATAKVDERGVARPQGVKCDEGAFELKP